MTRDAGFDPGLNGATAGDELPKSKSAWSHASHSFATNTFAPSRTGLASPLRRTTPYEPPASVGVESGRIVRVLSPVSANTYVPSDARPPEAQIPDCGLSVAHPP